MDPYGSTAILDAVLVAIFAVWVLDPSIATAIFDTWPWYKCLFDLFVIYPIGNGSWATVPATRGRDTDDLCATDGSGEGVGALGASAGGAREDESDTD